MYQHYQDRVGLQQFINPATREANNWDLGGSNFTPEAGDSYPQGSGR